MASPLVNYEVARPSDADDVVCLLAEVFSRSEPPAVAMGLSCGEMKQFLELVVPRVIPDRLTVVAREGSGKLAGAFLTDDFASPPELNPGQINAKLLPIFSMLEILDEQFRRGKTIAKGEYLHLFMLAVDAQFAGRGIAQRLVQATIDNGRRKGYQVVLTEATGKVSQHIFRKNGFADRFSVAYRDFVYENKKVFASIREHDEAILMERSLG